MNISYLFDRPVFHEIEHLKYFFPYVNRFS